MSKRSILGTEVTVVLDAVDDRKAALQIGGMKYKVLSSEEYLKPFT